MKAWAGLLAAMLCAPVFAGAEPPQAPVTFQEAVRLGLEHNLASKLAAANDEAARGRALSAAAALLPQVLGTVSQGRVYLENLAAMGFSGGGPFQTLIGPFNVFDARVRLVQTLFDLPAVERVRAERAEKRAAELERGLAAEQVVGAVSLSYVEALRARRGVVAAQAGVELAQRLLQLARDERDAGTAAGIDVARAETREAEERLRLVEARSAATEADLRLERLLGLRAGRTLELAEVLPAPSGDAAPDPEKATAEALAARLEPRIAEERALARREAAAAARAGHLPSVSASGDVGLSGNNPDSEARTTGSVGVQLALPIFSGGATRARAVTAAAERDAAAARLEDVRLQVEEDARLSVDGFSNADEAARTAAQAVALARKELEMARDRFAAGVGNNVELVNAQTVLARTEDSEVAALARLGVARINQALALGRMRGFKL